MIRRIAFLLLLLLPAGSSHAQPSEFATTIGSVSVAKLYPVIFTDGMGQSGKGEYAVPQDGATFSLEVAAAPLGFKLLDALWQPYDNLAAIGGFAQIVVAPGNDSGHLLLTAKPYPGVRVRLRLVVTAIYVRDPAQ
jgi:hypothetical protein